MIFLLLMTANNVMGQEQDMELWTSVELEKKVSKKVRISLEEELRFNDNISRFNKFYSNLGLSYRINKFVRVGCNYRFEQKKQPENYYSTRHRLSAELILRYKVNRFRISCRNRYQQKYADINSSDDGLIPRSYTRSRIQVEYNIRKNPLTPYISYEFYYKVNNVEDNEIDTNRYTAGLEYPLNKRNDLDIFFRIAEQVNVNKPVTSSIIGVSYSFSF